MLRVTRYVVDSYRHDLAGREGSSLWHRAEDHRLRQHYRVLGSYEFGCRESIARLPSPRTANNAATITSRLFRRLARSAYPLVNRFSPTRYMGHPAGFCATTIGHLVVSYGTRNVEGAGAGPGLRDCRPGLLVSCGLPMA